MKGGTHESAMGSPPHLAMMWVPFFWAHGAFTGELQAKVSSVLFSPPLGFPGRNEFASSFLGSGGLDAAYWHC